MKVLNRICGRERKKDGLYGSFDAIRHHPQIEINRALTHSFKLFHDIIFHAIKVKIKSGDHGPQYDSF